MVYRRGEKKKITKRETSLSKDGKQCGRKKNFSGEGSSPTCWESGKRHRKKAKGHNGYI